MAACGPGNPCTGDNECCSGSNLPQYKNKCGTDFNYCSYNTQQNLCGPCTTPSCFNYFDDVDWNGSLQCPQQVQAYKDCKFTKGDCINGIRRITIIREALIEDSIIGNPCPTDLFETCNNCIFSDWTVCDGINKIKTRTRTQAINGGTACTPNENALPLTQSCNDCIISDWDECNGTDQIKTRTRKRTQAINGGRACTQDENALLLTQICSDCIVSEWTGYCVNNFRVKETIPPINGGRTCPSISTLMQSCNDCIVSEWKACIHTNRTRIKSTIPPTNGGLSCPDPSSLTQTCSDCVVSEWSACTNLNPNSNTNNVRFKTIVTPPINGGNCLTQSELIQTCSNCIVNDWTGPCINRTRIKTTIPPKNGGLSCPNAGSLIQICSDCEVSEWSACSNTNNIRFKTTIPPKNGGLACPDPSSLIQTCSDCIVNDWTGPCTDGKRTTTTIPPTNGGKTCPSSSELFQTCSDCVVNSDWSGVCINNKRIKTTIPPINGGLACQYLDQSSLIQTCNDCDVSAWTDCFNNKRTRQITKQAKNGGTCNYTLTEDCTNCEVSEWSDCSNNIMTRRITQPTNGGFECNEQITTKNCDNCTGKWSNWTSCNATCNGIETSKIGSRTSTYIIKPGSSGVNSCTIENEKIETDNNCIKTCPINCSGKWSDFTSCDASCNGIETSKIGSRSSTYSIITPASNGGESCSIDDGQINIDNNCIKTCDVNCNGKWSDFTPCDATCGNRGSRKKIYTIINHASIGGVSCNIDDGQIEIDNNCITNCDVNCILSDWSEWSECDCYTNTITRIKKVINNNIQNCNNLIEEAKCSNNEKCLKLECELQNKLYNLQTKKCDNKNIFNYIIYYFNLIILFIMNLFK
jgi:hypothetical protein